MAPRERRRHARHSRDGVDLCLRDSSDNVLDDAPIVCDLSEEGLGLQTYARISPGEHVRCQLRLPDGPLQGTGRVCWVLETRVGGRHAGVELNGLSWNDARRLRGFLEDVPSAGRSLGYDALYGVCALAAVAALRWLGAF